jgi:hypothetical protein
MRSVNHAERVAHSPACPSRSRYSLAAGKRINDDIEWLVVEIEQVSKPSNLAVAATGMMETLHPLKPDSAPLRVHRPNWAPEPTEVESGSLRENAINQRSRARSDWTVHTVLGRAFMA